MSRRSLDISLVRRRDKEKEKSAQKKTGEVKRYRGLIGLAMISAVLGGAAGMISGAEVPIDGPDSPKIHLIHKIKYELLNMLKDSFRQEDPNPDKEDETPKNNNDSKIKIHLKDPKELNCREHNEDCLVS